MTETKLCPECQTALPPDSPNELCPRCQLLHQVATASVVQGDGTNASPSSYAEPFRAPEPAQLAAHFPQLEILALLGQGGMGAVYKARQPGLDRIVALKILPPEAGRDGAFAQRFTREARALARLNHPNIITIYDFGQSEGLYYFLMEYVDGASLRQLLQPGPIHPQEALKLIPQICDALQFAHEEGIVHRDIKPENILVDKKGRVKVADYGIAKLLDRKTGAPTLTAPWQVIGTLHYMAPEQIDAPLNVDHRADLYSLGVVFYEILTRQLPLGRFAAPSQKVPVDGRLDPIVLKALESEPVRRYQQARDLKEAIERLTREQPPDIPTVEPATEPLAAATVAAVPDWEEARRKVQAPAIVLMVLGGLHGVATLVGMAGSHGEWFTVTLLVGAFLFLAGWKMRQLLWYEVAIAASVVAMLVPPVFCLGIPVGIWSLIILNKPDVKAAFRRRRQLGAAADFASPFPGRVETPRPAPPRSTPMRPAPTPRRQSAGGSNIEVLPEPAPTRTQVVARPARPLSRPQGAGCLMMLVRFLAVGICIAGAALLYPAWSTATVRNEHNVVFEYTWARGFNVWPGLASGVVYLLLGCLLIGSFSRLRATLWQPLLLMLGSAGIAIASGIFVANHPIHLQSGPRQPSAITINGLFDAKIPFQLPGGESEEQASPALADFRILQGKAETGGEAEADLLAKARSGSARLSLHAEAAAFVSMGLGLGLLFIAALELRHALVTRSRHKKDLAQIAD